ncbi:hypothetical protein BDW75DRAFT_236113 [Aspergillus navahoensis]
MPGANLTFLLTAYLHDNFKTTLIHRTLAWRLNISISGVKKRDSVTLADADQGRTLSGGIVNLSVGASETPFDVHIELLCDRSSYFDNLLETRYTELSPQELVFPNDVPEVFSDFVSWAYCGRISSAGMATESSSRILHLFQLWTLAEKFQVPELRDIAFAKCKELLDAEPDSLVGAKAVQHAYLHSGPGSTIRQLAVDIWAARAGESEIPQSWISFPSQFIEDLSATRPGTQRSSAPKKKKKTGKDTPTRSFSPSSSQFRLRDLEDLKDLACPASEAQRANRKIKRPSSRRRKLGQKSQLSQQVPMFVPLTPASWIVAPPSSAPAKPSQRKVPRVRLPPSTDLSYAKFSMKSIQNELVRIE